jgi:hypothetical protein
LYTPQGDITELEEYEYNSYRLLTNKKKTIHNTSGGIESYEERTRYLSDVLYYLIPVKPYMPNLLYPIEPINQNLPCEKVLLRNGKVVAAEVISYKAFPNDESDFLVKDMIFQLETQIPLEDYEPCRVLGSTFGTTRDNRCKIQTVYEEYDEYGNPLYVTIKDGKSYVYLWSYKGQYPIAEIVFDGSITYEQIKSIVQTQLSVNNLDALSQLAQPNEIKLINGTLQNAIPNALVTTYTYSPSMGKTSETLPDGTTIYYEYDSYGRLKWTYTIVDGEPQFLEGNKYQYKNQ